MDDELITLLIDIRDVLFDLAEGSDDAVDLLERIDAALREVGVGVRGDD